MSEVVKLERHDVVAIVTVNSPPVNALSAAVRGGILECMKAADRRSAGQGDRADLRRPHLHRRRRHHRIRQAAAAARSPRGASTEMENCPKPIVAAIHGTALGGGLEVALGCHFRVATKDAKLGLPEVKLGLLPGAGGTQRLPRAVGPELAVKMIVGGDPIGAAEALKNGLIEEIVEGPAAGGEAFARKVLAEKRPLRKLRDDDQARGRQGRSLDLHQCGRRADQEGARPGSAVRRRRRGRRRDRPAVRRGAEEGARGLPQAGHRRSVEGAALRVLRRARGRQGRRRARRHQAAQGRARRHHRRRHHGRRHRDVVRQCRHSRHADRDRRGAAQARPGRDAEELRGHRGARRHSGGCAGQAHGPDQRRGRPRERQGRRPRHRGRVRDHGDQEGSVHRARQIRQARRGAGHQHLLSQHQRDRQGDQASAGRARHALLLAGQRDEAVRDRARRQDRAGCAGHRGRRRAQASPRCRRWSASATASSATACWRSAASRPRSCCSKARCRSRSTRWSPSSACRWGRSRWAISPASISAGARARTAASSRRSPTRCAKPAASARRPARATTSTRPARARRCPIRKSRS